MRRVLKGIRNFFSYLFQELIGEILVSLLIRGIGGLCRGIAAFVGGLFLG